MRGQLSLTPVFYPGQGDYCRPVLLWFLLCFFQWGSPVRPEPAVLSEAIVCISEPCLIHTTWINSLLQLRWSPFPSPPTPPPRKGEGCKENLLNIKWFKDFSFFKSRYFSVWSMVNPFSGGLKLSLLVLNQVHAVSKLLLFRTQKETKRNIQREEISRARKIKVSFLFLTD